MKRLLTYAAIIAAMLSIGGARAYFTAQTEVKDNVIRAGTLTMSVEPTASALSIEGLAPGETISKTVEIQNTGRLGCEAVTSAAKKAGITELWTALECRAVCEGVELYKGPLAALKTTPVRVDAGRSARITYAIGLPATAGNNLQGDYVNATVYIDAEQLR